MARHTAGQPVPRRDAVTRTGCGNARRLIHCPASPAGREETPGERRGVTAGPRGGRPGADQDIASLSLFADQAALAVEAVRAFEDVGRVLLSAVAAAADGDSDLAAALDGLAADIEDDAELAELAAMFAELARVG